MKIKSGFRLGLMLLVGFSAALFATDIRVTSMRNEQTTTAATIQSWQQTATGIRPGLVKRHTPMAYVLANGQPLAGTNGLLNLPLQISANQRWLAGFQETPAKNNGRRKMQCRIFDLTNETYHDVTFVIGADAPLPIRVLCDDGSLILGNPAAGTLDFFQPSGEFNRQVLLSPEVVYDYEKPLKLIFNEETTEITVLTQLQPATLNPVSGQAISGKPVLIQLDKTGNLLWQRQLSGQFAGELAVSPAGNVSIVSCYSTLAHKVPIELIAQYDQSGHRCWQRTDAFQRAIFSPDQTQVLLVDQNHAQLLAVDSGVQQAFLQLPEKNRHILAAAFLNGSGIALLHGLLYWQDGGFVYQKPELSFFSPAGREMQTHTFADRTVLSPALYFDTQKHQLAVGFQFGYEILEVNIDDTK